ncbi:hypothetical protein ACE41V_15215, partial [Shigella sonnei]
KNAKAFFVRRFTPGSAFRLQSEPQATIFQHVLPLVELIYEIPKPLNPYACDVVLDDWLQAFQDCGEYSPHV